MRIDDVASNMCVSLVRELSPRHKIPFDSRNEGSRCVPITRRALPPGPTAGAGALTLAGILAGVCLGALCCSLTSVPAAAAPAAFAFNAGGASAYEGRDDKHSIDIEVRLSFRVIAHADARRSKRKRRRKRFDVGGLLALNTPPPRAPSSPPAESPADSTALAGL